MTQPNRNRVLNIRCLNGPIGNDVDDLILDISTIEAGPFNLRDVHFSCSEWR